MNIKKNIIIGIDLGGTKIMTGAITLNGNVIGKPVKVYTGATNPKEEIVKRIIDSVEKVLENLKTTIDDIEGIGIGSTGPLNINQGIILECPQLPTMNYFPLRKTIKDYFSVPVFMNNDANCLIYGEAVFGSAAQKKNIVGFTLGTGIGCAIILNKNILNGSTESAGEIWPSPYQNGKTIEDFISGKGVTAMYKSISGKDYSSKEILELAEKGDKIAIQTWNKFGEYLAVPIAWSINMIDPEVVVLGGSIANASKFFLPSLEKNLRNSICPEPAKRTKIVLASLGDYAGFIGAAALALTK